MANIKFLRPTEKAIHHIAFSSKEQHKKVDIGSRAYNELVNIFITLN